MLACFAGSFLTNFLLGEPIVAVLKQPEDLLLVYFLLLTCLRIKLILKYTTNFIQMWIAPIPIILYAKKIFKRTFSRLVWLGIFFYSPSDVCSMSLTTNNFLLINNMSKFIISNQILVLLHDHAHIASENSDCNYEGMPTSI